MTFFEDALLAAKNAAGTVYEKTGRVVDISKLRLSAAEITKEIERRYEALGRLVYDSQKEGTDISGLIEECARSIDALYTRLDEVNSRIAKLKDKKYCGVCGAIIERNALYCSRCGSRVEVKPEASEQAQAAPSEPCMDSEQTTEE